MPFAANPAPFTLRFEPDPGVRPMGIAVTGGGGTGGGVETAERSGLADLQQRKFLCPQQNLLLGIC